jgi:hypothetical protein
VDIVLHGSTPENNKMAGDLGAVWGGIGAFLIGPGWKALKRWLPVPYRTFVFSLVCFTGVAATGVFLLVSATAQGSPAAFTRDSVSVLGLIFTAIWASQSWSSITNAEPDTNPEFREKHRAFGLKAGAIILSVLLSVAVAGTYFGIRASHVTKLDSLFKETHELSVKVAPQKQLFMKLVREDTKDLPQYLQRCAELEPAINDYEASERQMDDLMSQVQHEIEELKPKANYASALPVLNVMRTIFGKDLEAAKVYRQEIEFAKQLPGIPESGRTHFYIMNIQPIVEQEHKIAMDEVAILKDAKARGVEMPESLYRDAGIK